jgi:predicted O-methyltransferase YrrM
MSNVSYDYIEDYIRGLIPKKTGDLKALETYAEENHVPIIHPEVGQFLRVVIKSHNVKRILEVGCAIGYSACLMAQAAGEGCHVTTIERDDEMYDKAVSNIASMGLDKNITVLKGDALELLDTIEGEYDMIFLDAAKGHYDHFLPNCMRVLKKGGIIVGDNVLFRGMVASKELVIRRKITIVKRMRKYLQHISNMNQLETVVLPIGDGVAFSCKVEE